MGYKTYCKRYGEFKEKLDEEANSKNADAVGGCPGRRLWLITAETDCLLSSAASKAVLQMICSLAWTRARLKR